MGKFAAKNPLYRESTVLKYSFSILLFSTTLGGKIPVERNQFFEFPTF